jgi:isopenicillin N synthase-like dioxygenase
MRGHSAVQKHDEKMSIRNIRSDDPPPRASPGPVALAAMTAGLPLVDVGGLRGSSSPDGRAATAERGAAGDDTERGSSGSAAVARAIDAACRRFGFFRVTGHGIDPRRLTELDRLARAFFAQSAPVKERIGMARGGPAWRGWFPLGGELTGGRPDAKEGIYFGAELPSDHPAVLAGRPLHGPNLFPAEPSGLRDAVLDWMDAMADLGALLLRAIALGLGLEPDWFATTVTAAPTLLFRIFHYPSGDEQAWGVAEHTDYGLLTILAQDRHGGLEVRGPDGWIEVPADPDVFVVNLGDMLERMTGGRYRSTPHRVRNTSGHGRLSFPFFLDPSWDAVCPALPLADTPPRDDDVTRWDGADPRGWDGTYGDYLTAKVARVFPQLGHHLT